VERTIRHIFSYKPGGAILSDIQIQQLFFIDETGALCSKQSGHAIDITGKNIYFTVIEYLYLVSPSL